MVFNVWVKFHENMSSGFKVMERTQKLLTDTHTHTHTEKTKTLYPHGILRKYAGGIITNGSDSKKNVGGNMAPVLCTTFDDALYLYQNS